MKREFFETFYTTSVDRLGKELADKHPEFEYKANLNGVYEEYLNQRTALRYLIKSESMERKDKEALLLDGHKVSACLTCAIIKVRLMVCKEINDTDEKAYSLSESNRMNEQLAVLCGLACLISFMMENEENLFADNEDRKRVSLRLPETNYNDRSEYLDSLIRGLYYSNLISTINPLMLSDIFFMIEKYHRKCIEFENFKTSNSK